MLVVDTSCVSGECHLSVIDVLHSDESLISVPKYKTAIIVAMLKLRFACFEFICLGINYCVGRPILQCHESTSASNSPLNHLSSIPAAGPNDSLREHWKVGCRTRRRTL